MLQPNWKIIPAKDAPILGRGWANYLNGRRLYLNRSTADAAAQYAANATHVTICVAMESTDEVVATFYPEA